MNIVDFFKGHYSHEIWKKQITPALIIEFLGTLFLAWLVRPIWEDSDWKYRPFLNYISELGQGRTEGNLGAWIFLIGFCMFCMIETSWASYLYHQFKGNSLSSKLFAILIWLILEIGGIMVAFVGIFDGVWPNPELSGFMHFIGATFAFLNHTIAAVLLLCAITFVYYRTPISHRQQIYPPWTYLISIIELITTYLIFRIIGGSIWQWIIMLSLMVFVGITGLLFPQELYPKNQEVKTK